MWFELLVCLILIILIDGQRTTDKIMIIFVVVIFVVVIMIITVVIMFTVCCVHEADITSNYNSTMTRSTLEQTLSSKLSLPPESKLQ